MQFPAPSETFAAVEVRALRRAGADVWVHAMRPKPRNCEQLLAERGLSDLSCTYNSLSASLRGLAIAATRPSLALKLLVLILHSCGRAPAHLFGSLILFPRAFDLLNVVLAARADVVHLFWGHYPSLVGLLVCRTPDAPLVSMFLGAYDLERQYGCSAPLARVAPVVWTHARANLPSISRLGTPQERLAVAYRGIELAQGPIEFETKGRHSILLAERLVPAKKTEDALRLLQAVQADFPDATMVVLGDGPQRKRLEALAAELDLARHIAFKGHVSHEQVFEHMNRARIFLALSQSGSERLPNAVKEAMYRGCICIVAESTGIAELITHGVHGFVIRGGDIEAAQRQIADIFTTPEKYEAMAAAARRQVMEVFDVDVIARMRVDKWRSLLQSQLP